MLKGGTISLAVLLSCAALLDMYHPHFVRQVIRLGVVMDLMSWFALIPRQ
jgi:hypothetical protein